MDSSSFEYNTLTSLSFLQATSSQTVSNLMANAVTAEKSSQILQNAGVTVCCSFIISAGAAGVSKPAPPSASSKPAKKAK